MKYRSSLTALAGLMTVSAVTLSACSSGGGGTSNKGSSHQGTGGQTSAAYNAAVDNVVNASTKTGGTLRLLSTSDCDSWDPQRTYLGWCWNMQRLFTRSLIGYKVLNGDKFELAPDLATNMGTHNADFTEWTYTLKPGLKWSNGQPLTVKDIQYGISRLWAVDVINGGPSSYFLSGIKAPKNYAGPYKGGGVNTVGMTTTANSITFHLTGANADFDYLMAMSASAPVPAQTEGGPGFVGATYTKHPLASGPFMIQSYQPAKSITFVRNPNWDQSTDTIRHPLLSSVTLTIDTNPGDLDDKLQAGEADANAANAVSPAFQAKILTQPDLKKNADDPVEAAIRYFAVMQSVIPDVHCRLAIFYASNKAGFLSAYGGTVAGEIAGSMTPPGIEGYDASLNPYPVASDNTGDVAKAKQELAACGKPNGFSTKFAYATPSDRAKAAFLFEQSALARVGIHITAVTSDQSTFYTAFIGSPRNIVNQGIGIALAGWGADFPTPVGFWNAISNGNAIFQTGNSNYPSLNDPAVNTVLDNGPKGKATEADWKELNAQVMTDAVYLPGFYEKFLYYRNPRMTNVTCDNALAFGIYDFVNVGVS